MCYRQIKRSIMKIIKKVILGSFIGTLLAALISSTYFYSFVKKRMRNLNDGLDISKGLDKWDDIKKF